MERNWRADAGSVFECEKRPARGARGMVVTNHPLATAAGAQMLLAGGNAVDAAVAALFALGVVEPMMVGPLGGGLAHLRLPDGRQVVVDGLGTAPRGASPDMYRVLPGQIGGAAEVEGRANTYGALAVAVPGALAAWCHALAAYGSMELADVMAPAIDLASRGFRVTHYLAGAVGDAAADLAADPALAALFLPGGAPIAAGARLVQGEYAESLRLIAARGPGALYAGPLGAALSSHMAASGGLIGQADLASVAPIEREPLRGTYRGWEVTGPPPPSSAGVHILQMLNLLEGYDVAGLGFGTAAGLHLLAEALKIAFADRAVATADPAFVRVPLDRLLDKGAAAGRRAMLDPERARAWSADPALAGPQDTTHVTVADHEGRVVATTQTLNSLFGARIAIPGTGMIANNYMLNFDPEPGRALSIVPGKRVFTSMAPMIVLRDGRPRFALGLPGGLRIFGSALQAIVNLLDHGMSLQEAVEAPRIWAQGHGPGFALELEPAIGAAAADGLAARGHAVRRVKHVAGGMNAVRLDADGMLEGAACWRADGTAAGLGGGLARPGVRFELRTAP